MEKNDILAEIRRTAQENGGAPVGQRRFEQLTGITVGKWRGRFWRAWSDALREAGLEPNLPPEAYEPSMLLQQLAQLTRRLGRFPTYADLRLERSANPDFPSAAAFNQLGNVHTRIDRLRTFAAGHVEHRAIVDLLPQSEPPDHRDDAPAVEPRDGTVYMLKLARHYKIGKTFSVPRRHREIALELPEKPDLVHVITTDDPAGIESYWHNRFAAKRTNGEWFALTRDDVRAFKRRKFM
jgi:hypothetical protein